MPEPEEDVYWRECDWESELDWDWRLKWPTFENSLTSLALEDATDAM
jgi:hypothetical protein